MTLDELIETVNNPPNVKKIKLTAHPDTDVMPWLERMGFEKRTYVPPFQGIPIEPNGWIPIGFLRVEIEGETAKLIRVD